ncbi:MAG: hypothetical protein ACRES7_04725 [Gammaproteobacteria bacterium]
MKKGGTNRGKILKVLLAIAIVVPLAAGITACSRSEKAAPPPPAAAEPASPPPPPPAEGPKHAKQYRVARVPSADLDKYSVTVSATQQMQMPGPPGELSVCIGVPGEASCIQQPDQAGMASETEALGASGNTAKVTPYTLGIDVEPKESICEKIVPSGSEVRFTLTPTQSGTFTVGADVALYDSTDCSGTPVPKSAKSVSVKVSVNKKGVIEGGLSKLGQITWDHFLTFWGTLIGIVFALILFLIRKKLYKWFGFKDKE